MTSPHYRVYYSSRTFLVEDKSLRHELIAQFPSQVTAKVKSVDTPPPASGEHNFIAMLHGRSGVLNVARNDHGS
jgi:hypothetical protein